MSTRNLLSKTKRAYKFIEAHCDKFGIRAMCRLLSVAPAGYYAWLKQPVCDRAQEDARLLRLMRGQPWHLWRTTDSA